VIDSVQCANGALDIDALKDELVTAADAMNGVRISCDIPVQMVSSFGRTAPVVPCTSHKCTGVMRNEDSEMKNDFFPEKTPLHRASSAESADGSSLHHITSAEARTIQDSYDTEKLTADEAGDHIVKGEGRSSQRVIKEADSNL
jgi:hypothetical protein